MFQTWGQDNRTWRSWTIERYCSAIDLMQLNSVGCILNSIECGRDSPVKSHAKCYVFYRMKQGHPTRANCVSVFYFWTFEYYDCFHPAVLSNIIILTCSGNFPSVWLRAGRYYRGARRGLPFCWWDWSEASFWVLLCNVARINLVFSYADIITWYYFAVDHRRVCFLQLG